MPWLPCSKRHVGVAQYLSAKVARVLVIDSIHQGAILGLVFEPRPFPGEPAPPQNGLDGPDRSEWEEPPAPGQRSP